MFEKVNPMHPDKIADRIAGALVDYAYEHQENPKIAVEVLIGHGECHIIAETSVAFPQEFVERTVKRIAQLDDINVDYKEVPQDVHLAANQSEGIKCGDNGIFRGVPTDDLEKKLSNLVRETYKKYPTDGKYILRRNLVCNRDELIACQSHADDKLKEELESHLDNPGKRDIIRALNPLGDWTGGVNVDSGATNRKLGSDMGRAATGGGLHGKDLSKADVSVNIYLHLQANGLGLPLEAGCAIGDERVADIPYEEIVAKARDYIKSVGGFEKFAEWGLI